LRFRPDRLLRRHCVPAITHPVTPGRRAQDSIPTIRTPPTVSAAATVAGVHRWGMIQSYARPPRAAGTVPRIALMAKHRGPDSRDRICDSGQPHRSSQAPRAADSSARTVASASTDTRRQSADLASAEPTLRSAQAACARTSGSGSDNARESTGTAAGEPQLPSPTQTLRANPALPAEPRENESHAASSSAVSSNAMSEGERVPGCDRDTPASSCAPNGASPRPREANAGGSGFADSGRVVTECSSLLRPDHRLAGTRRCSW
jgi:hypothetical protein